MCWPTELQTRGGAADPISEKVCVTACTVSYSFCFSSSKMRLCWINCCLCCFSSSQQRLSSRSIQEKMERLAQASQVCTFPRSMIFVFKCIKYFLENYWMLHALQKNHIFFQYKYLNIFKSRYFYLVEDMKCDKTFTFRDKIDIFPSVYSLYFLYMVLKNLKCTIIKPAEN